MTKYSRNHLKQTTFWLQLTRNHLDYIVVSRLNVFKENGKEISILFNVKMLKKKNYLWSNKLGKKTPSMFSIKKYSSDGL